MKLLKSIALLLIVTSSLRTYSQENIFIGRDFWKTNQTIAQIEQKIKEGNNPSQLNRFGFDAVVYALLQQADENIIKHLLTKKGNDANKLTHDGRTYIFWAAYKNNIQIVKHLLNNGAKTDVIDDKGYSLLNFTAVGGVTNTKLYDLLISKGTNVLKETTPKGANALLLIASSLKDLKMVDYFTDKGIDINTTDENGNGIFNYASRKDNRKILELLIKKGLPYKKINNNGGNAMLFATKGSRKGYNSLEYFKYLENLGINPNITNKKGETPLHNLASRNKDIETLQYFISKGVDVNQTDSKGDNALLLSSHRNSLDVISLFTEKIKNINYVNKKGYSALTNALNNSFEVVEFLIDKGAKTSVIDKKGNDLVYHLFQSFNSKEQDSFQQKLVLLKSKGLKINKPQKDGTNLYHIAVKKNSFPMLELIKKYAININAKNKKGLTPLQQAVMTAKDHKMIKYFLRNGADKNVSTDFDETLYDLAKENEALKNTDISYLQ